MLRRLKNIFFVFALTTLFASYSELQSQSIVYFNLGAFNVPSQKPFVETYLTLVGSTFTKKFKEGGYQNSVNIQTIIKKDSVIVAANKYNLSGPLFTDTTRIPAFIDNQRYPLENGIYQIEITVKDNHQPKQKAVEFRQKFDLSFNQDQLSGSSIQVLESFKKADKISSVTKSGYDLIPYNINYFPETQNELCFYFESYNSDTILGKGKSFIYSYYLENSEKRNKLESYASFKKQQTAKVNPLLAKMDISKLGTGNYNLVIELKDENNVVKYQTHYFFQRLNRAVDLISIYEYDQKKTVTDYFGSCNNKDTLKMFVECLWPIAGTTDKERIINQAIKKDPDMMKKFVIDFWKRRAADTANPLKLWAEYYKEVQQVMVLFKCGKQPGYYTERGRVYLQYGAPNQRSQQNNDLNTWPYEIWQYYRITDKVNGQFSSNKKFVFVNKNIGDDCHSLVHSDVRGEIYNDRWPFEVTKRNTKGIGNPDQTTPSGTQFNQFEEIYNNPR